MSKKYDIAIIGSGPGGYVAALHAAHHSMSVCVIEKSAIGGTCLNRGCIPTKAYAASRDALNNILHASDLGIDVAHPKINFGDIFARKNNIVKQNRKSVTSLLRGSGVDLVKGNGKLVDKNTVIAVNKNDGSESEIKADNIIIATGSRPMNIPAFKIDHINVLTSSDVLKLDTLPKEMVIIGGGIIGCEFASIFAAFGVNITIVELLDSILPTVDTQLVHIIKRRFKREDVNIITGVKVDKVMVDGTVKLTLSDGEIITTDKVLVSIGRASNISGLWVDDIDIKIERDKIIVDDKKRTSVDNIYAIGDVTDGPMLAHKASYDGICAVNNILGIKTREEPFHNVPSVVFTDPEIAYVGLSEEQAKEQVIDYKLGRVSYASSSKALCMGKTDGLIKVIAKKDDNVIIGAAICGAHASDLIYGLGVAISNKLTAKDVYETIFSHPTLSEMVKEALEDVDGLAIHKISKR